MLQPDKNSNKHSHYPRMFSMVYASKYSITFLNFHVDHVRLHTHYIILILSTVCNDSLGMEDRRIPDSSFFASGEFSDLCIASNGRLNRPSRYAGSNTWGAWSPSTLDANQYIGVNLGGVKIVSGIVLQGMEDGDVWVTKFKVEYKVDSDAELMAVKVYNQQLDMVYLFLL